MTITAMTIRQLVLVVLFFVGLPLSGAVASAGCQNGLLAGTLCGKCDVSCTGNSNNTFKCYLPLKSQSICVLGIQSCEAKNGLPCCSDVSCDSAINPTSCYKIKESQTTCKANTTECHEAGGVPCYNMPEAMRPYYHIDKKISQKES